MTYNYRNKTCIVCNEVFKPKGTKQVTCSPVCYLASNLSHAPANGCWEWTGSRNKLGYGVASTGFSYRFSYELFKGPVPKGLVVRHKCDNPPCVNPDHLELGTQKQNIADMFERGRNPVVNSKGMNNSRATLTDEQVLDIFQAPGTHAEVARQYGVAYHIATCIRRGETWTHVTGLQRK